MKSISFRPTKSSNSNELSQDFIASSLERIDSRLEARFNELSEHVQNFQGDALRLLFQVRNEVKSLETIVQMRGGSSARGSRSARQSALAEATADAQVAANSLLKTNGNAELVPLLSEERLAEPKPVRSGSKESVDRSMIAGMTFQEKLKVAQDSMQAGKIKQSWIVKEVTAFLEDPESSACAQYYSIFMVTYILFAIVVGLLPFVDSSLPVSFAEEMDVAIDAVLFLEILIRGMFCPNHAAFFKNSENIIDGLSAAPLIIVFASVCGALDESIAAGVLLVIVPFIRFMRLVRRFPKMQILISAFKNALEALPVLMYIMATMACLFTSLLYLAEPRSNIATVSQSAWLVLSTMTTVGFGDVTPSTQMGHGLTSILMIVSPLFMAMPFGIIGYSFTNIWSNRAQILLLNGTRDRLAKWGFGAYDIPRLFALFDLDESAEIDLHEFLLLLKEMEIGFREDDVTELFKAIDKDCGGTIDEKEFVKTLYPSEYRNMYGKKKVKDIVEGDAEFPHE